MYVSFWAGGKQHRAVVGAHVAVELQAHTPDQQLIFQGSAVSASGIQPVTVHALPLEVAKAPKVIIFKKQKRQNHRRKKGHRQSYLWVRIVEITHDVPKVA